MVAAVLSGFAVALYLASSYYSAALTAYVVEQTLVQKLPQGENPALARSRFREALDSVPDRKAKLRKLLSMSQFLERRQLLTPRELDELLRRDSSDF
jgi:hypothetical protein